MEKKSVSAFEYAISEAVNDIEFMKKHRPRTKSEELERRRSSLLNQAKRLKVINK